MKILLVLVAMLVANEIFSQVITFNNTYDLGATTSPVLNNLIEIDNNFYINGFLRIPNKKVLLLKINNTGTLIDTTVYGTDTLTYYVHNLIRTNENTITVFCEYEEINYNYNPFIIQTDTFLNIQHDTIITLPKRTFYGSTVFNNNYYLCGTTRYLDNGSYLSVSNCFLYKATQSFDSVFTKSIGLQDVHEISYVIKVGFDNNLLIGGSRGVVLSGTGNLNWYFVNVDTSGNVLGEYIYGHPYQPDIDGIKSISLSSDSSYYVCGLYAKYYTVNGVNCVPRVVKIDRDFNIVWEKDFGKENTKGFVIKVIQLSDNNQLILYQEGVEDVNNSLLFSQAVKFNNDGNILFYRNYHKGDTTQHIRYRAWDIIETSDHGFALCGSAIDTNNVGPNQQAWLVKTDSLGCDGFSSCNDTAMVVQILNYPDTLCKDSTHQIAVRLKGRSAPYSLYANSTMALDSIYYPYTLPLWIDTIINFTPHDTGWQPLIVKLHETWERTASDTVQVYVRNCTTSSAPQEYFKQKVEIFPNPATTELHVKIRGLIEGTYTITMYDTQGNAVDIITTKDQETVIDISKYRQGVYWVRVLGNNIVKSEKVIILKND